MTDNWIDTGDSVKKIPFSWVKFSEWKKWPSVKLSNTAFLATSVWVLHTHTYLTCISALWNLLMNMKLNEYEDLTINKPSKLKKVNILKQIYWERSWRKQKSKQTFKTMELHGFYCFYFFLWNISLRPQICYSWKTSLELFKWSRNTLPGWSEHIVFF